MWPRVVPRCRRAIAAQLREYLIDRDDIGTLCSTIQALWPTFAPAMADLDEVWRSLPAGATSPPDLVCGGDGGRVALQAESNGWTPQWRGCGG